MKLQKDIPFTVAPNALIQDNTISDRARFLYVYMASKPEDWEFFMVPLSKELGMSVKTLRKYIKELCDKGWITNEGQRNQGGDFGANTYIIHSQCTVVQKLPHGKNCVTQKCTNIQKKDNLQNIHKSGKEENKTLETLSEKVERVKSVVFQNDFARDQIKESIELYSISEEDARDIFRDVISNFERDNYKAYINNPSKYAHKIVLQFDKYAQYRRKKSKYAGLKKKPNPTPLKLKKLQRI